MNALLSYVLYISVLMCDVYFYTINEIADVAHHSVQSVARAPTVYDPAVAFISDALYGVGQVLHLLLTFLHTIHSYYRTRCDYNYRYLILTISRFFLGGGGEAGQLFLKPVQTCSG